MCLFGLACTLFVALTFTICLISSISEQNMMKVLFALTEICSLLNAWEEALNRMYIFYANEC